MRIPRHRECAHGPAVKRMVHRDDLMIGVPVPQKSIFARRLQRTLNRLRAAVCKKDSVHARNLFELLCRLDRGNIIIIIRGMNHLVNLFF